MEAHWQFYIEHEENIRRLARRMGREREEELMGEAAMRLPRIFECYDGRGNLEGHVHSSLKWYFYKMVTRRGERVFTELPQVVPQRENTWHNAEVQMILERLCDADRRLLELRCMHECTFEEIAILMGYSNRGAARKAYMAALARAQGDRPEADRPP